MMHSPVMCVSHDTLVMCVSYTSYRIGQPEECAGIVSLLCSDDASYITGEIILVTGGVAARL